MADKDNRVYFILNNCFGGFSLSTQALNMIGIDHDYEVERYDERLVNAFNVLGSKC